MMVMKAMLTILLAGQSLTFELAISEEDKQTGMMYREEWDKIDGMLFVNQKPQKVGYWMKDTPLEMTMLFMDKDFNILETYYPTPYSEDIIASASDKIRFVLEIKPELEDLIKDNKTDFQSQMKKKLKAFNIK